MTLSQTDISEPSSAGLQDYVRIMRLDHMTKHVFILPGLALALLLRDETMAGLWPVLVFGFAAAVAIASANYVINEWLDREFDAHHPEKSQRAAVQKVMNRQIVFGLYTALLCVGLALSLLVNTTFCVTIILFGIAGVLYNVEPIRLKDRVYMDVLSESLNNPLRLVLGWTMVDASSLPPLSLLLGFWFGGAFLMNSKRLAEYRAIVAVQGRETLHRYRKSFRIYNERSLLVANLIYALMCAFFIAVFLVKYRTEYLLGFPMVVVLFAEYFRVALLSDSIARKPEKLFQARRLMTYSMLTALAFAVLTVVDLDWIRVLSEPHFIELGQR